jgi:hypothetical protein
VSNRRKTTGDPRRAGGGIAGPGGPFDRNAVVVDSRNAVLLDHTEVVLVETTSNGNPNPPAIGMALSGRINRSTERTQILYLMNEDGATAIVSELVGMAGRIGPDFAAGFQRRLAERLAALPGDGEGGEK